MPLGGPAEGEVEMTTTGVPVILIPSARCLNGEWWGQRYCPLILLGVCLKGSLSSPFFFHGIITV